MWHDIFAPVLVTLASSLGSIGVFWVKRLLAHHFNSVASLAKSVRRLREDVDSLKAWRTRTLRRTAENGAVDTGREDDAPSNRPSGRLRHRDKG